MTVLAILSGIVFLRYIHDHKKGEDQTTIMRYVLGVLAMTVLAILSGIVFLRYIHEHKKGEDQTTIMRYV